MRTNKHQKLVDGKNYFAATEESNYELKDNLLEAKNVVVHRVKGTQGTIRDSKEFYHTAEEMCEDTNINQPKFLMEKYAQNLARKFNFPTDNSGHIIMTQLQVACLGRQFSKHFSRSPTMKFVLGTLDTEIVKISDLPNELLRYIFLNLSLEDRKMAVLVSRRWREVGEDPVLWKWTVVKINNGEDVNKLSAGRVSQVREICVNPLFNWQEEQLEELFKATLKLNKLNKIHGLPFLDVSSVKSELLERALEKYFFNSL